MRRRAPKVLMVVIRMVGDGIAKAAGGDIWTVLKGIASYLW